MASQNNGVPNADKQSVCHATAGRLQQCSPVSLSAFVTHWLHACRNYTASTTGMMWSLDPQNPQLNNCFIQCWSVFKIQVFKLLLKILYMYLVFSILNTFPVFILLLVFKLLFCMYLVFCSLQNQNTFFKILLNNKHVVYDYFDYFALVIIHS